MNNTAVKLYDPENFLQSPSSYGWDIGNVAYSKTYEVREVARPVDTVVLESVADGHGLRLCIQMDSCVIL